MPFSDRYSVDHGHLEVGLSSAFNALVDNGLKLEAGVPSCNNDTLRNRGLVTGFSVTPTMGACSSGLHLPCGQATVIDSRILVRFRTLVERLQLFPGGSLRREGSRTR